MKRIQWGFVLSSGWLTILVSAAVILPHTESKAIAFPILALMLTWFLLSFVVLIFYFYQAWRRVDAVKQRDIHRMD